ncbi:PIG-L deacetylase family protein [Agilicoccus flavus]|uniref:PIG-L deacetylase family protein n=1 Tax=Agilicoccus flavus TaxID=2775968 RepID=UPI001CF63E74|nr:PIG-L family deacetylase [Agilicoccus flavus]
MVAVSTIVYLHAHPDDEASQTSGQMTLASRAGHRVVVVYATNGDHGEVPDDLVPGETLVARRRGEAQESATVTGAARVAWLDYADSGMTGWDQNADETCFHAADLDEAAGRLAAILDEEDADVLVGYDWHGGYGHPDHVKVHRVAHRAAELAARRPRLLESTMNRDALRRSAAAAKEAGLEGVMGDFDPDGPMDDGNPMGLPEDEIHWAVDVSSVVDAKRAALACHRSQKTDIEGFLAIPEDAYALAFGVEFLAEPGGTGPMRVGWPFGEPTPG